MMDRRDALTTLAILPAAAGLLTSQTTNAAPPEKPTTIPALAGRHVPRPLPFAPSSLRGISEKLIVSHHDNNYAGAVKNLNRVESELAAVTADTPPFIVAALREKELTFRASMVLHEAYFGNLGGDGRRSGAIEKALADAYGTTAVWEEQFRATAMGLGGGSGWVVLGLEVDTGALRVTAAANHTQSSPLSVPLLVLDMYEHAYALDYGSAHSKYVDAFFANVAWDEVNRRLEAGRKVVAAWAR